MSARHAFTISLTLRSPFLLRGLEAGATGVDATQLRNECGWPIIPADQVRGVAREAMSDLVDVGAIDAATVAGWFGAASADRLEGDSESDRPARGTLIFGDLAARTMRASKQGEEQALPPAGSADTTRVMIDDGTGTASEGSLQVIELTAPFGALVRFSGPLVVFAAEAEAGPIRKRLSQALALVGAIGAMKSAGYGEVVATSVDPDGAPRALALPASPAAAKRGLYRVTFDRPVLVDAARIADNAFLGSTVVPGAVFKAALARRLQLSGVDPTAGALGEEIAALSFSHAYPESAVEGQVMGMPMPMSLVAAAHGRDVVIGDAGDLAFGAGAMLGDEVGLFQFDWKKRWFDEASVLLGHYVGDAPPAMARTHTAIKDGVADESKLFTTVARASRRKPSARAGDQGEPFSWLLTIDATDCRDDALAGRLLAALAEGLDGIGKTGATASLARLGDAPAPTPRPVVGKAHRHIVVLASDALLVDPVASTSSDGTAWSASALEAYAAYWKRVLPEATLANVFARERWAGAYLSFRRRPYGGGSYHPFLVTLAGATFVLDDADPQRLRDLCRTGLPLPSLSHAPRLDWRTCPFVRENGYGRITADHCSDPAMVRSLAEVTGV